MSRRAHAFLVTRRYDRRAGMLHYEATCRCGARYHLRWAGRPQTIPPRIAELLLTVAGFHR